MIHQISDNISIGSCELVQGGSTRPRGIFQSVLEQGGPPANKEIPLNLKVSKAVEEPEKAESILSPKVCHPHTNPHLGLNSTPKLS